MKRPSLIPLIAFLSPAVCSAAVLVYEDYDYALADGTTLNGVATSATGFTGSYAVGGTGGSSVYATTGLTFGANYLPVSGGATRLSASVTGGSTSSVLGATISVGGAQTGTLWSSYLVNITSKTDKAGATAQARVSDLQTTSSNNRLNALADSGTTLGTGIAYDSTIVATTGTTLTVGTTYLMLSQYTNVGTAGGGTATLWIFNLAGYNDWLSLGGGLEANLGSYDITSQSDSSTTQADFGAVNDFYQFAVSNTSDSLIVQTVIYDELRWGTSLGDVVSTVPEPGTAMSMAGALAAFALLRRRSLPV
jgi:PEP-CTERM motif